MNAYKNTQRLDYLDNLKWVLIVLVIYHHSAILSIPASMDSFGFNLPTVMKSMQWQYDILWQIPRLNQSFFMALFFLISAYFTLPSLRRKGGKKFILDRIIRLGIPTFITVFILMPAFAPKMGVANIVNFWKTGNIMLGVTWFLWVLLLFNILSLGYNRFFVHQNQNVVEKPFPAIWKIILFSVIIIPINYLGLYLNNTLGDDFLGFHHLKYFPLYIAMFYFGLKAYQYHWLDKITFKHAFLGIFMWGGSILFLNPIFNGYTIFINPAMITRGFTVIGMSLFLIYSFKMLFNISNVFTRFLSRSAFATYVIHAFLLVVIYKIFKPFALQTPIANFIIIAIPTIILSFLLGYLLCKLPGFKRIF